MRRNETWQIIYQIGSGFVKKSFEIRFDVLKIHTLPDANYPLCMIEHTTHYKGFRFWFGLRLRGLVPQVKLKIN